jgi:hypothetical protein
MGSEGITDNLASINSADKCQHFVRNKWCETVETVEQNNIPNGVLN